MRTTSLHLNIDLNKISSGAFQWKMSFNPDPIKHAQEVIFSRKTIKQNHPNKHFNQNPVVRTNFQKHLGIF